MSTNPLARNTLARRGVGLRTLDESASSPGYTLYAPIAGDGSSQVEHSWLIRRAPRRRSVRSSSVPR